MEKKSITSNLFRFVTLRSPQLADERKKDLLFVSYPEEKELESIAHQSVARLAPGQEEEKAEALEKAYVSENFDAIKSRQELRKNFGKLYDFSSWLSRNKHYLTAKSITENLAVILADGNAIAEAVPTVENSMILQEDEEILLWNNLFYQTIHKTSTSVREILIQLLITNRFLQAFSQYANEQQSESEGQTGDESIQFTEEQQKEFTWRANASVIIPKEVLYAPKSKVKKPKNEGLTANQSEVLEKMVLVDQAKSKLKMYETALQETERAELLYNKEEEKKYQAAVNDYQQRLAEHQSSTTIVSPTDAVISPADEISTEDNPALDPVKIIPFTYVKSPEIVRYPEGTTLSESEAKVVAQLSAETQALMNTKEFEVYDTFAEVKTLLQSKIKRENQIILENAPQSTQGRMAGGNVMSNDNELPQYGYSIVTQNVFSQTFTTFDLYLNVKDVSKKITAVSYEIIDEKGVFNLSGTEFRVLTPTFEEAEKIKIFPKGVTIGEGDYTFKGEVSLSDGTVVAFDSRMTLMFQNSVLDGKDIGFATVVNSGDAGADSESPDSEEIYGVTQLGIADFRRVEQEVCCYVPGEVSHIENIMAREYKERSVRNLTSHESTNEVTSEKEAEVLTDTTSTERNELQRETSSIVNEDTTSSFGANASVSAKIFGSSFSAGSNYNSSSSNSISDSNLQAQSYAQEVTERALERVVEKVSRKRTTRILKEHEENTTHGFDNRKGDEHVTGVYRWVDVIYKNKMVNYGKRLMYEFAIPEPAKFYISSNFKNNENNDQNNSRNNLISSVKPINPKDLVLPGLTAGLKNASQIDEGNYQRITSIYNAEVNPFPKQLITVGKSFSLSYSKATDTNESANLNGKIELPEGYKSIQATVGYSAADNGDTSRKGFYIHVGNKKMGGAGSSLPIHKEGVTTSIDNYVNEVPVSAVLFNYFEGALNIGVNCTRTDEYYQQWQNETFNAIMNAYYERVQEYNEFQQAQEVSPEEKEKQQEFSSQINRGIEKRELKRIAIDLMTAPFKDLAISRGHYGSSNTKVIKSESLNDHASVVKFFEQAFDWEIMAYTFYPYFYKEESKWADNFEYLDANDPIFKAFLQSGMARTVVPVTPGFETAVNWFMNTGELWNGQGIVTDTEEDLYVSIAEEMLEPEGEVEGTWETRVPTALTILQADSVVLDEGGLPCNPDCGEHSRFKSSTYRLGGAPSVPAGPEGVDFDIVGETNTVQ